MPVLIIAIIAITIHCIKRRCKRRRNRRTARRIPERIPTVRTVAQIEKERREREKAEKAAEKQAAADRKKALQKKQAYEDIAHLQQMQRDILTAYSVDLATVNDATQGDRKRCAAFERNINRDCKIRSIQKKIEKAQFILTEP
jgi:hypothetical protein